MVRPGPKTTQEEVKTAVVKLLQEHPEGLNFNQIFRELKREEVLGSFSVLSRAVKDLRQAGIADYEDTHVPGYKIPKRTYRLTDDMDRKLRQFCELYAEAKKKEAVPLEKIVSEEELLDHVFRTHINNMISVYRLILIDENPVDENARWKLILNLELRHIQTFMSTVAKAVSQGKIPIKKADKAASKVLARIM